VPSRGVWIALSCFKCCQVPGFCINCDATLEDMKVGPLITDWKPAGMFSSLKKEISVMLATCFLFGLFFSPGDGGSTIFRNVGELVPHYTASRRARCYCSPQIKQDRMSFVPEQILVRKDRQAVLPRLRTPVRLGNSETYGRRSLDKSMARMTPQLLSQTLAASINI
jgi:hypothetical protein